MPRTLPDPSGPQQPRFRRSRPVCVPMTTSSRHSAGVDPTGAGWACGGRASRLGGMTHRARHAEPDTPLASVVARLAATQLLAPTGAADT